MEPIDENGPHFWIEERDFLGYQAYLKVDDHIAFMGSKEEALEWSAEKWEFIAELPEKQLLALGNYQGATCACCAYSFPGCSQCPIAQATGESQCWGIPYYEFKHAAFREQSVVNARKYARAIAEQIREIRANL